MFSHFFKNQWPNLIGIDIGSYEIKAIALAKTDTGFKVLDYANVPILSDSVNRNDRQDLDSLSVSLRQLSILLPKKIKQISTAVSGFAVMTKRISFDANLTDEEMEAQVEIESSNLIPYPLDEVSIDFEIIGKNSTEPQKNEILLSACRTDKIDFLVDAFSSINLEVKIVDIEGYALGRTSKLLLNQLPDGNNKVICIVDIGAKKTTVSIIEAGKTVIAREQDIGGEQLTHAIQSYFSISYEDAEKMKCAEASSSINYFSDLLQTFYSQLVQQIQCILQIYSSSNKQHGVDHIFLTGGSAKLAGLDVFCSNQLGIQTQLANPFLSCLEAEQNVRSDLEPQISKFMLACGLAMRSFD